MHVTHLPVKKIPFLHAFPIVDGVHVSMEVIPPGHELMVKETKTGVTHTT